MQSPEIEERKSIEEVDIEDIDDQFHRLGHIEDTNQNDSRQPRHEESIEMGEGLLGNNAIGPGTTDLTDNS